MRLRQVALIARDLETSVASLCDVLGLEVGFRDPGVGIFGLANAVLPVGNDFLEVVSPVRPDASGARLLEKRAPEGDGCGYMAIVQTDALGAARERAQREGVRVVFEHEATTRELDAEGGRDREARIATVHLHPRDVGGAILSFDEATPPDTWGWAGPAWRRHVRTDRVVALAGATLSSDAPAGLAARWAALLDRPASALGGSVFAIALDASTLRFVPAAGRGEGLVGVTLAEASHTGRERALARAHERGLRVSDHGFELAGVEIRLVDAVSS